MLVIQWSLNVEQVLKPLILTVHMNKSVPKLPDDAYTGSQIILKVRAPKGDEIQKLAPNTAVIAMFDPYRNTELDQFASTQVSAFALELLPPYAFPRTKHGRIVFASQLGRL